MKRRTLCLGLSVAFGQKCLKPMGDSLAFATSPSLSGFEVEFLSMGSQMNLRWFADHKQAEVVSSSAKEVADRWVKVLSDYDPQSEAMVVCDLANQGDWVAVSNELWSVLKECDYWNRLSQGAFDAALGALTRLRRQKKLAKDIQWRDANEQSGWEHVELDASRQSIRFDVPGIRLDFGAIGKGFVADRVAEELRKLGIEQFVVNASGNMRMGQSPDGTAGWPISLDVPQNDPSSKQTELYRLRLNQCGVATSGDRWQRFPDAASASTRERFSHILDPKTKQGLRGRQSVTILANNASDADAAATATCVRSQSDLSGWLNLLAKDKPEIQATIIFQEDELSSWRLISTQRH